MSGTSAIRRKVLAHVHAINAYGEGSGARCTTAEMINEAEAAERDGQLIWRDDTRFAGRFITDAGLAALFEDASLHVSSASSEG